MPIAERAGAFRCVGSLADIQSLMAAEALRPQQKIDACLRSEVVTQIGHVDKVGSAALAGAVLSLCEHQSYSLGEGLTDPRCSHIVALYRQSALGLLSEARSQLALNRASAFSSSRRKLKNLLIASRQR